MTRTIVKAVKDAGIQAILAKGWSDRKIVKDTSHSPPTENKQNGNDTAAVTPSTHSLLVSLPRHARKKLRFDPSAPKPLPSFIYPLKSVPHDWLFPRIAGVVHHGGAGTTAAGLRAGVPTIIKPFFGDQNFWAERVESVRREAMIVRVL